MTHEPKTVNDFASLTQSIFYNFVYPIWLENEALCFTKIVHNCFTGNLNGLKGVQMDLFFINHDFRL